MNPFSKNLWLINFILKKVRPAFFGSILKKILMEGESNAKNRN